MRSEQNRIKRYSTHLIITITTTFILSSLALCSNGGNSGQKAQNTPVASAGATIEIKSDEQFKNIIESSPDRLLAFDLYADWCAPCRILSPVLEELAKENSGKVTFYKINVDKLKNIAAMFGVSGIPFVVFVKNKTGLQAFTGVQPKAVYQRAIDTHAQSSPKDSGDQTQDTPDGEIKNGERVVNLSTATSLGNIYVFRGENVRLKIGNIEAPYEISIPQYKIVSKADSGKIMEVAFKAEEIGVFPIFCNGKCPADDGSKFGQIIVMEYKGAQSGGFTEMNAKAAAKYIEEKKPLILDVRTPNEYYAGHLENSVLIPLQQLEERVGEIQQHADKPVLIYCRSGNRSVVAAQILHKKGFKNIAHIKTGIIDWQRSGFDVVK